MERIVLSVLFAFIIKLVFAQTADSTYIYGSYTALNRFNPWDGDCHIGRAHNILYLFDKHNMVVDTIKLTNKWYPDAYVCNDSVLKTTSASEIKVRGNKLCYAKKTDINLDSLQRDKNMCNPVLFYNYIVGSQLNTKKNEYVVLALKIEDIKTNEKPVQIVNEPFRTSENKDTEMKYYFFDNKLAIFDVFIQRIIIFDKNLNKIKNVEFESDDFNKIYWDYIYDYNHHKHYALKINKSKKIIEIFEIQGDFNEMVLITEVPLKKITAINGDKIYYNDKYEKKGTIIRYFSFSGKYDQIPLNEVKIKP